MNRRNLLTTGAAAAFFIGASPAFAKPPIYTQRFRNLAIDGHDPVAYFTIGAPTLGEAAFTTEYKGAEWRFASQENLDLFLADSEAYAPQYGGYCAWAIAQGNLARGNPKFWKIVDGKLYLNFNADIQQRWEADIPGFIASADSQWPAILEA